MFRQNIKKKRGKERNRFIFFPFLCECWFLSFPGNISKYVDDILEILLERYCRIENVSGKSILVLFLFTVFTKNMVENG